MDKIITHHSSNITKKGVKIIKLYDSLDSFNIDDVIQYIKKILNNTKENVVVFDMSELRYISAQSIGALFNIFNFYKKNKYIYILGMNNKIKEMFNLLGFVGCCTEIEKLEDIKEQKNIFPLIVQCPSCGNKITIIKSGRFNCESCKTEVSINKKGKLENEKE